MQDKKKIPKIWVCIILYILFIYLTLPVMRPVLNFIYATVGRSALGYAVNSALLITSITLLILILKKKNLKSFLLVLIPIFITMIFIFKLKIPEERVHFLEYGLLGYLSLSAIGNGNSITLRQILLATLFVTIVGGVDEFIQLLLPNRVGDLRDVMMNATGGALGVWVGRFFC